MNDLDQIKKIKTTLKKSVGSINKMITLLDEKEYASCEELLIQLDSAIGSLKSARSQTMEKYLEKCLQDNIQKGDIQKLKHELSKLYKLKK